MVTPGPIITATPRPAAHRVDTHRLRAAGLRAVAANPGAEIRGHRLEVDGAPMAIVVPYLSLEVDLENAAVARRRGVVDALGLRLRHSDRGLHLTLSPTAPLERIVFDIAEQFRCEARADPTLQGVAANTTTAFESWSETARGERIAETGVGLLVYTITHMLRFRLLRIPSSEAVDDIVETTRGNLARLTGHALRMLPATVDSQEAFAEPAAEIARLVAELADDASEADGASPDATARHRLLIPVDWDTLNEELAAAEAAASGTAPLPGDDYRVFTTAYDIEVSGAKLYRAPVLRKLRSELDQAVAAQVVSRARLAQRLQYLFPGRRTDGWEGGHDDGPLDPARMAQIVADPANPLVRRVPRDRPTSNAVVTFLVDTSGSMKLQRYETVAVLVETFVRALELAGANAEVLGFTTAAWTGGRAQADWRTAGSPPNPGRLTEVQHIVYKSAEQSWRQARLSLAAMLRTDHYREGVDGEALEWAWRRLLARPETRRALVVISDGHPSEAATANANHDHYLLDHLRAVSRRIEQQPGRDPVALGAICLESDQTDSFANALVVDLDGPITIGTYGILHELFAR